MISEMSAIVEFIFLAIFAIKHIHGSGLMREIKLQASKNPSGEKVCSTGNWNQVVNEVRSRIECNLRCRDTPGCRGVNWKKPSTCEMYPVFPNQFQIVKSCAYFSSDYSDSSSLILRNDYSGSLSGTFNRSWAQYEQGFGNPSLHYWIGLGRLHDLSQGICKIRFDLQDTVENWYYAQYSKFTVSDSSTNYTLTIGGWSGNVFDAMEYHNGRPFTTPDADNDACPTYNCASFFGGGFWYGCQGHTVLMTTHYGLTWFNSDWMQLNFVEVLLMC